MRLLITVAVLLLLTAAVHAQTDDKNVVSLVLGDKVVLIPAPEGYGEVTTLFEALKTRFDIYPTATSTR